MGAPAQEITQARFAAEMGVSRKWLSEIENGKETAIGQKKSAHKRITR